MDLSLSQGDESASLYTRLSSFVMKFRRTYLAATVLFALMGYAFVLLFPLTLLFAGWRIYDNLFGSDIIYSLHATLWTCVLLLAAQLCYRCWQVKAEPPAGLTLKPEMVPEVFALIERIQQHYKRPRIHRVVITPAYEMDIVKVPRAALPLWSSNTLVIGLPVLLSHSPRQFECMLARRIGQYSKRRNPLLNWLYQLRAVWPMYATAYGKQKHPESRVMKWFYSWYARAYKTMSLFIARREELNADSYLSELYNDADIRQMITADSVYRWQLKHSFWPAVEKVAMTRTPEQLSKAPITPYQKLVSSIHTGLDDSKLGKLMEQLLNTEAGADDACPSLRNRLKNIGHDKPAMKVERAAAFSYLGTSLDRVIDLFDKLWLKDHLSILHN